MNTISLLFFIGVIFTLLSQIPQILQLNIAIYFQSIWILLLVVLLITKSIKLNKQITNLFLLVFFLLIYVISMDIFTDTPYMNTPHYVNMLKTFFILLISFYAAPYIPYKIFKEKLTLSALFGGLLLSIMVYFHSFHVGFDITSIKYAYGSKNSVSQIILSCIIIVLFLFDSKKLILKIIRIVFILFALYMLFILKSRATLIGLVFVFIAVFLQSDNRKLKYYSLLFFSIASIILFLKEGLLKLIYNSVILGNREGDLNNISSGRVDFFLEFPDKFMENVWFGHGHYFSESFLLSNLLEYGIIGSFFVFIFLLQPIIFYKRNLTVSNPLHLTFLLLIITYYINGMIEEQAPLGPGSKNFFLWLIFGYLLQQIYQIKKRSIQSKNDNSSADKELNII